MPDILARVSLKARLIISLTAVLFFAFLATNILNYTVSKETIHSTIVQNTLPATGSNIYSEIQRDLMPPLFIASLMANDTFLKDWVLAGEKDMEAMTRYLEEIRSRYGFFTSFFVSEATGLYYSFKGVHKKISAQDDHDVWYYRFKSMEAEYDLDVDTDEVTLNTLTIFINQRVNDYQGKFLGVAGVGLTVDQVGKLLVSYKRIYGKDIYLVDPEGIIQVHPDIATVEKQNIIDLPGISAVAADILRSREAPSIFEFKRGGKHIILESRYIGELDWFLLVEQNEDILLADIRRNLYRNLLFGFLISCLVIAINIVTVNHFQKRLEAMTVTDELTKLGNRRDFDRRMDHALSLAARQQAVLSVALFDIDFFKQVNDKHGHLKGDEVIRRVASIALSCIRKGDVLARWGGDEFSVVCFSRLEDAKVLMERIRRAVEEAESFAKITISVGLAEYRSGDSADSLIARADRSLYRAKADGKNRVETEQDLPPAEG